MRIADCGGVGQPVPAAKAAPLARALGALIAAALLLLCTAPANAQNQTPIYNLRHTNAIYPTNWIAVVVAPNQTSGTVAIQLSTLINSISVALTNTLGTNVFETNATVFPIFLQNNGNLLEHLGLQQGTNMVLYRTATSIVVNATGTGSGSGSVETQWLPDQSQFFTNAAGVLAVKPGALFTNISTLHFTNRGNQYVAGTQTNDGAVLFNSTLDVNGTGTFGAVHSLGAIVGDAFFNKLADLRITGGDGVPGTFAIFNGSSNLVGWIATNSFTTHAQLVTASNDVHAVALSSSNALHTLLLSSSNGTHSLILSSSNGLHSLLLSASNALFTHLTTTSNGLRSGYLASDTIVSNAALAFAMAGSNTLDLKIENTLSNYYGFGYSVGAGFSNTTSKPLITAKANRMLEVMNLIAGANIALTPASTGLVITATGASLADGDYGDVTATAGGATITIDNDVVTDAKLRESAGFSVIGKTDTGTGNPADIVAGTDGVLRRSGSGNLIFGSLVTANYGDDSITYAKIQNVAENRIMGRDSTGSGNMEELTAGLGIDIANGSAGLLGDQVLNSAAFTNGVTASNGFFRHLIATNTFQQGFSNTVLTTNIALSWLGPPVVFSYPTSTTFMVSFVSTPAASNGLSKWIEHYIVLTNSPTGVFPTSVGWFNTPVLVGGTQASPSTNRFVYKFDGNTNLIAFSSQESNLLSGTLISGAHITGSVFSNGVVYYTIFTNGVLLGTGTNLDFVNGMTGYVNGATIRLGTTGAGGSGATNTPVLATGILDLTNQIKLRPQNLNGSNSYSVMMDFELQTHKKVTNPIGAHTRFIGTNYTQGHKIWMTLRGLSGTTNNVQFTNGLSGVNFRFHDWPTNLLSGGTNDITVRGGFDYDIVAEVEDPTNITFKITSNDPYVPVPSVIINYANIGTNNAEAITNLSAVNFRLFTLLVPTNNAASNIVVNYALTNRVEIYATNNLTFTNYSGNLAGQSGTKQMWIRPQLITRGVNWGIGIGYSVRVLTNAANPLWTSLTNDKLYVVTDEWQSTNIIRTIALFE